MNQNQIREAPAALHPVFLGGDLRMDAAAAAFPGSLRLYGKEGHPPEAALADCDSMVLPLPLTKDGIHLYAPLCADPPRLELLYDRLLRRPSNAPCRIFAGVLPKNWQHRFDSLTEQDPRYRVLFYGNEPAYLEENATLTAAALRGFGWYPAAGTVCGIAGFGRVAKAVARQLKVDLVQPVILCRREATLAEAAALGYKGLLLSELPQPILQKLPLLLNTVPAPVFTGEMLEGFAGNYGELASKSGLLPNALPPERVMALPGLPGRLPAAAGLALAGALRRLHSREDEGC